MYYMIFAPVLDLLDEYGGEKKKKKKKNEYGTLFNANEKHAWRPEFESTQGEKKQEGNKYELHSAFVLQDFFLGQSPSTDFHRLTTPQITNHWASSLLPLSLNFYEPFFLLLVWTSSSQDIYIVIVRFCWVQKACIVLSIHERDWRPITPLVALKDHNIPHYLTTPLLSSRSPPYSIFTNGWLRSWSEIMPIFSFNWVKCSERVFIYIYIYMCVRVCVCVCSWTQ